MKRGEVTFGFRWLFVGRWNCTKPAEINESGEALRTVTFPAAWYFVTCCGEIRVWPIDTKILDIMAEGADAYALSECASVAEALVQNRDAFAEYRMSAEIGRRVERVLVRAKT